LDVPQIIGDMQNCGWSTTYVHGPNVAFPFPIVVANSETVREKTEFVTMIFYRSTAMQCVIPAEAEFRDMPSGMMRFFSDKSLNLNKPAQCDVKTLFHMSTSHNYYSYAPKLDGEPAICWLNHEGCCIQTAQGKYYSDKLYRASYGEVFLQVEILKKDGRDMIVAIDVLKTKDVGFLDVANSCFASRNRWMISHVDGIHQYYSSEPAFSKEGMVIQPVCGTLSLKSPKGVHIGSSSAAVKRGCAGEDQIDFCLTVRVPNNDDFVQDVQVEFLVTAIPGGVKCVGGRVRDDRQISSIAAMPDNPVYWSQIRDILSGPVPRLEPCDNLGLDAFRFRQLVSHLLGGKDPTVGPEGVKLQSINNQCRRLGHKPGTRVGRCDPCNLFGAVKKELLYDLGRPEEPGIPTRPGPNPALVNKLKKKAKIKEDRRNGVKG